MGLGIHHRLPAVELSLQDQHESGHCHCNRITYKAKDDAQYAQLHELKARSDREVMKPVDELPQDDGKCRFASPIRDSRHSCTALAVVRTPSLKKQLQPNEQSSYHQYEPRPRP